MTRARKRPALRKQRKRCLPRSGYFSLNFSHTHFIRHEHCKRIVNPLEYRRAISSHFRCPYGQIRHRSDVCQSRAVSRGS